MIVSVFSGTPEPNSSVTAILLTTGREVRGVCSKPAFSEQKSVSVLKWSLWG